MNTNEMRKEADYWAKANHTATRPALAKMLYGAAEEIDRLRAEVDLWVNRHEAERKSHEATVKQANQPLDWHT